MQQQRGYPCTYICTKLGGAAPTDVTAEQTGLTTVLISWTAPPAPPANGYKILVTGARNVNTTEHMTTRTIQTESNLGVFIIRVMSCSQHLPGQISAPAHVTVRGREQIVYICYLPWYSNRYPGTSSLSTISYCHISHHHLESAWVQSTSNWLHSNCNKKHPNTLSWFARAKSNSHHSTRHHVHLNIRPSGVQQLQWTG